MNRTLILGFLLYLLSSPALPASMPPVRMKIVDGQDGKPIAGAYVLFQGNAHEGTLTGHGGRSANLFVAEAVTDETGEIRLPKQEFSSQPFFLNTNYDNPSMVVFKPGYVLVVLTNNLRIVPNLDEVTTWQYNNQTIRVKRATTDNDLVQALTYAAMHAEQPMSEMSMCYWKKIPRFLVAVDRLAEEWNGKRATIADTTIRNRTIASPLQKFVMNDGFFIEKGCGSPKAFFEPYQR